MQFNWEFQNTTFNVLGLKTVKIVIIVIIERKLENSNATLKYFLCFRNIRTHEIIHFYTVMESEKCEEHN